MAKAKKTVKPKKATKKTTTDDQDKNPTQQAWEREEATECAENETEADDIDQDEDED